MKLLVISPYYPPHTGGLEYHAQELFERLNSENYEITILTTNIPSIKTAIYKTKVIRLPSFDIIYNYPFPKLWSPKFWKIILTLERPDIYISITRFFLSSLLAAILSKLNHRPWIHIEHGSDFVSTSNIIVAIVARLVDATLGKYVFTHATVNIAPSYSAAKFIAKFDNRASPVIHRGLPYEFYNNITKDKKIQRQCEDKIIITFAGRLIPGKGLSDLLHVMGRLPNNVILLLIGSGSDEKKLRLHANSKPLKNKVKFLGSLSPSRTISIIKASDIIVNPSYNEGLPTLVLEAAAQAKAIVASNIGGTSEIVTDEKTAFLFKPGDINHLTNKLMRFIESDSLRKKMGKAAQKSIQAKFNWAQSVKKFSNQLIMYDKAQN